MPEQPARRPRKTAEPPPPPPADVRAELAFREGIVPRDSGTQALLSVDVNEWWLRQPLGVRLGVHAALSELHP